MGEKKTCPDCGTVLAADAPDGFCPGCLLGAGAAAASDSEEAAQGTETAGQRIGPYRLLRTIGEGGCGLVYMAEQEQPVRRKVALKLIKLGMDTRQVVARFEAERQALALMDHPNIAKVFDAGATEAGRPYFVMELVEGIWITDYSTQKGLGVRERLELFIQVCQAVQHAHQKGVIHRDLKPSNILVSARDGVAVPKVIDFGIAKATEGRLTGLTLLTGFEQFLGTPAYMSPEQAELTTADVDTRSDIYSLGVLLYELLTGATPFDTKALLAAGLDELRRAIRQKEPLRPSVWLTRQLETRDVGAVARSQASARGSQGTDTRPTTRTPPETKGIIRLVRGDLDWIVMKCLEKDRARRYETANGLARDIQRHLNNEPVVARPPSRLYEFQKTVRRHKVGFAAAAAVMLTLASGAVVSTWEAAQARAASRVAGEQSRLASRNAEESRQRLVRQYVANGSRLMNEGDLLGSLSWYAGALNLDQGNATREEPHRIRIAAVLRQCPKLLNILSHGTILYSAELSPDGTRLVTASSDGTARVWEPGSLREMLTLRHDGEVHDARFSPDGRRIITASQDQTAKVWDSQTGVLQRTLTNSSAVWRACFAPHGPIVATAGEDHSVQVWNWETGERIGPPLRHEEEVEQVAFSPDQRLLGTQCGGELILWDVASGTIQFTNAWSAESFGGSAFSTDGKFLTVDGPKIHVWDLRSFTEPPFSPIRFGTQVTAVAFSPDGHSIVAGTGDGEAWVWDATSGKPHFSAPIRQEGEATVVAISPDGRRFLSAGTGGVLQMRSVRTGQPDAPPIDVGHNVVIGSFSSSGRMVLDNGCVREAARLWDLAVADVSGPMRPIIPNEHLVFSPDHRKVLMRDGQTVWVCKMDSVTERIPLRHTNQIVYASFSRDRKTVVTVTREDNMISHRRNRIYLWDAATGKQRNTYDMEHRYDVLYAAFTASGDRMLTCGDDGCARLWDAGTGRALGAQMSHNSGVSWAAFSPDGWRVVTASDDKMARVWDGFSGEPITPPMPHHAVVVGAWWSDDGRRLFTITKEDQWQAWDLPNGEPLGPPRKIAAAPNSTGSGPVPSFLTSCEPLPRDERPVASLVQLAELLSLTRIDSAGNALPLQPGDVAAAWQTMHLEYPDQFATKPAEAVAWHQQQARESRAEGDLTAALFHLDQGLAITPSDKALAAQRDEIKRNLESSSRPATPCFPPRDPKAGPVQIDLSPFYNRELQRPNGNDLRELGRGLLTLNGVSFDVRGIVYLNCQMFKREGATYPESVKNIRIGRKCQRLHFLQGAGWDSPVGTVVGTYVLHYVDGQERELPIRFGRDLNNWWFEGCLPLGVPGGAVPAWTGSNRVLYDSVRENPLPDVALSHIDFISTMSPSAPFLVALTIE